jgi:hypothetical protein
MTYSFYFTASTVSTALCYLDAIPHTGLLIGADTNLTDADTRIRLVLTRIRLVLTKIRLVLTPI